MSSWPSLVFWGISTILELVGKCVPFIDQMMDTVEAFIVPVLVSCDDEHMICSNHRIILDII